MLLAASSHPSPAAAYDPGRVTLIEENDAFASRDDRHYTQGLRLSYLSGAVSPGGFWDSPFDWLAGPLPVFAGNADSRKRKIEWIILGQSLFTPARLEPANPDPRDRPYAGWLYTGASLLQDQGGHSLERLELLLGVVGPSALGKQTQNDFHQIIEVGQSHGWGHQLQDEPGLVLSYERDWRFELPLAFGVAVDAVPELGASLGNVLTYGEAGGILRIGQNLGADYGPTHIRPSQSGGGWFDADRMDSPIGWYAFVGAQGRAVGRNIFLDGNSWQQSRSVDKKPLVGDLVWGAALFWSDRLRVDFTVTDRSKEFYGQKFPDRFGMITLSIAFW